MQIFHPRDGIQRSALLRLLQDGLRPDGAPYPIETEYPLVLGAGKEAFSYCLGTQKEPVAHAHLWPRRLKGGPLNTDLLIGLVGNVVTHQQFRGQGLARELLEELKLEATQQGLSALVLWSDLHEFYQKCGFTSCGEERRWLIKVGSPANLERPSSLVQDVASIDLCDQLLACRWHEIATIQRNAQEFADLLRIPGVSLMTDLQQPAAHSVTTFTIMGKGCDMVGVVHEWGAPHALALVEQVKAQGRLHGISEVLLLTPARLPSGWYEALCQQASQSSRHPMALAWCVDDHARQALEQSFIWGLDSI